MTKFRNLFLCVLGVILITSLLFGQIATKGRIVGTVTDEEGNPLPGVTLEATSPSLLGKATAVTDASGKYRLLSLPSGIYTIKYTLPNFKTVERRDIVIHISETITVDITMGMGAIEEEITVIGQSPLIDVKSTTKGMTLTKMMFEVLPKGRNFDTLVTAVAGVNVEPGMGGSGLSVDGASSAENMYYVDGTDITSITIGTRQQSAAFEFVEEVQVLASGYEAEYGGALGGVVSVITRQGGNEFHGEIISYYGGEWLEGPERDTLRRNPLNTFEAEYVNYQLLSGKEKFDRYEVGFSLGGYIIKDKIWFFGSFLPVFRTIDRPVDFLTTPAVSGVFTEKQTWLNFQGKITAQPFSFMRVGGSFVNNFYKWRGDLPSRAGTSNPDDPDWANYGFDYPNWSAAGFADLTLGSNLMANIKGGRFYYNQTNQQVQPEVPNYYHTGYGAASFDGTVLEVPAQWNVPTGYRNKDRGYVIDKLKRYKNYLGADFTYFAYLGGEHAFKFGVQWVRQGEDVANILKFPDCPEIRLFWGRDAIFGGVNYGTGTYGYYEVRGNEESGVFGEKFNVHNDRWAIYAQDSWTIREKLTLNLGIRLESEYVPPYSEDPSIPSGFKPLEFKLLEDKIAPRIGFIYDVFGDTSLKIFGSYGLYFDVIKTYMPAHSYAGFKWQSAYYEMDSYQWDTFGIGGNYPGAHLVTLDWRKPSFDSTDPSLKPVSQREISFGVEKMLMENLSATARVVQKHLRHTIEDVGVIIPGVGESYFECNPGFGYSLWTTHGGKFDPKYPETPKAKREYLAINFSLDKRLSNNWLAGLSYTWSKLTGNYAGLGSADEWGRVSPYVMRNYDNWAMAYTKDLVAIDGKQETDRTHFLKFYGAYTFPFRLTVGAVMNAMSGVPISETWDILSAFIYPYGKGYHMDDDGNIVFQRTPFVWYINLYAEYNMKIGDRYRVQLNLNIDNLTNNESAYRVFQDRTMDQVDVTEDEHLAGTWELTDPGRGYIEEPRWMKKYTFQDAISVRLGLKFMF